MGGEVLGFFPIIRDDNEFWLAGIWRGGATDQLLYILISLKLYMKPFILYSDTHQRA
jgi:hypothetical protein